MRVYLHSFSYYCLQNTRNIAKFQENLTLQQFPRSSILVSMESPYMTSYYSLIVTLAVCAVTFRKRCGYDEIDVTSVQRLLSPTTDAIYTISKWYDDS